MQTTSRSVVRTSFGRSLVSASVLLLASGWPCLGDQGRAAAAGPAITISPSSGLEDGDVVRVAGSGWDPAGLLAFGQCNASLTTCFSSGRLRHPTAAGSFENEAVQVRTIIGPEGEPTVDCRLEVCVIVVQDLEEPSRVSTADLHFEAGGPLLPPPMLTVTPSESLRDGDVVTVRGEYFTPGMAIALTQCPVGATRYRSCDQYDTGEFGTSWRGRFEWTMVVVANFEDPQGTSVDCRLLPCEMAAIAFVSKSGPLDGPRLGGTAIEFDPAAPLRPPATAVANPTRDLPSHAEVEVQGNGFLQYTPVHVYQCPRSTVSGDPLRLTNCDAVEAVSLDQPNDDGSFQISIDVAREYVSTVGIRPLTPVDCLATPCALAVFGQRDTRARAIVLPLTFAPSAPGGPGGPVHAAPAYTG